MSALMLYLLVSGVRGAQGKGGAGGGGLQNHQNNKEKKNITYSTYKHNTLFIHFYVVHVKRGSHPRVCEYVSKKERQRVTTARHAC